MIYGGNVVGISGSEGGNGIGGGENARDYFEESYFAEGMCLISGGYDYEHGEIAYLACQPSYELCDKYMWVQPGQHDWKFKTISDQYDGSGLYGETLVLYCDCAGHAAYEKDTKAMAALHVSGDRRYYVDYRYNAEFTYELYDEELDEDVDYDSRWWNFEIDTCDIEEIVVHYTAIWDETEQKYVRGEYIGDYENGPMYVGWYWAEFSITYGTETGTAHIVYDIEMNKPYIDNPSPASGWTYDGNAYDLLDNECWADIGTVMYKVNDGEYSATLPQATDAGTYTIYCKVIGDGANYYNSEEKSTQVIVEKADAPAHEVPTGIAATYGQTLADVTLPAGWRWNAPATSVGNVGSRDFAATYNPDTVNYNDAASEDITLLTLLEYILEP